MRATAALASLLLAGCATSSLVLLPDDEGHQGAVAVLEANGQPVEAVIADGNSRTKLGNATPASKPLGDKGLKKQEAALLTSLPPPAKSFLLYFEPGHGAPRAGFRAHARQPARRDRRALRARSRGHRPYRHGRQRRGQ